MLPAQFPKAPSRRRLGLQEIQAAQGKAFPKVILWSNAMLADNKLDKLFPKARYHAEHHLVTWFPSGVLNNDRADQLVDFLESEEKVEGKPFDRFTDMTGYTKIELGLDHIVRLARRRRHGYSGGAVRSAFYAVRLLSLTIARMYEELMTGSKIQVCTFRDRRHAAEWLGVPVEVLKVPKP